MRRYGTGLEALHPLGTWPPGVRPSFVLSIALVALSFATNRSHAQTGGIEVFAGETLFRRGWRISETYLYRREGTLYRGSNSVSDPQDRLFQEHRVVTGVDYGLLADLTVSGLLPVVHQELRIKNGSGRDYVDSFGLGDLALLLKYRYYKIDWEHSTFATAVVTGLEFPTGRTDEKEDGVRLPPRLQPGFGAWNPFAALATRLSLNRVRLDLNTFYKVNTEGSQNFEPGDFLSLSLNGKYRFWHTKYPGPTAGVLFGVQWRHQGRDKGDGRSLSDSGSDLILLSPGIGVHPIPNMDLSLSVDVPVYQNYNGEQLGWDVRTILALGFRF
ncbi:MAG: transporter [Planctomycetes bacterium]|nr:transporter [Planctomycetota bacterium]